MRMTIGLIDECPRNADSALRASEIRAMGRHLLGICQDGKLTRQSGAIHRFQAPQSRNERNMAERGWKQLLANHTWFHGQGQIPDQRLFGIHAAAAAGSQGLRIGRWRAVRRGRPVGLARHRIRRSVRIEAGLGANRQATGHGAASFGALRAGARHLAIQAARQSLLDRATRSRRRPSGM